ncbi:MAG: hypothetical protein ACI87N_003746 [Flavobacteriales bacterium]
MIANVIVILLYRLSINIYFGGIYNKEKELGIKTERFSPVLNRGDILGVRIFDRLKNLSVVYWEIGT